VKIFVGQTRSRALIAELEGYGWGEMTQPKEFPPRRRPWALDNAAFIAFKANKPWDREGFVGAVERAADYRYPPDFVVAPDIVAGGWDSLQRSLDWLQWLKDQKMPVYLAVQDGMTLDGVAPYVHDFDGIFVGGGEVWKILSGWWWVRLAHAVGRPCHIGRISGRERVRLVKSWGTDSIDSCVPLWSEDNRRAVLLGLQDPPPPFDPPEPEQFLTGWEAL
jgi:hypothetical protein